MILVYKQCLSVLCITIFRYSLSAKITTNFPKRRLELTEISITFFKPNNFLDVRIIYQDKASMDMTLDEFKYLTSTCWNKNYQPLTIDMTKDKYTGRYRLGLNSIFVPNSSPF